MRVPLRRYILNIIEAFDATPFYAHQMQIGLEISPLKYSTIAHERPSFKCMAYNQSTKQSKTIDIVMESGEDIDE